MNIGLVFLAGGLAILLAGFACRRAGDVLGLPARLAGGTAALLLGSLGGYALVSTDDNSDWMREPLTKLHRKTVAAFAEKEDFGWHRMPNQFDPRQEHWDFDRTFKSEFHRNASTIHSNDSGFLKTWEGPGPTASTKTRWTIRKVQLVGLTQNPTPVVYLADRLPKMNEIAEIPTRPLDEFETQALGAIRQDLVFRDVQSKAYGNLVRMMAPIYATEKCVQCHEPQMKLLGAFTYEIERSTAHNDPEDKPGS